MTKKRSLLPCPCGGLPSGSPYERCCSRFLEEGQVAPDAHHLMRSRYTAYAMGRSDYVRTSWHPSTRPVSLELEAPGTPHAVKWLGLAVHSFEEQDDHHATVRFTARYREGGRAFRMTETSRFIRENGCWFYAEGEIQA